MSLAEIKALLRDVVGRAPGALDALMMHIRGLGVAKKYRLAQEAGFDIIAEIRAKHYQQVYNRLNHREVPQLLDELRPLLHAVVMKQPSAITNLSAWKRGVSPEEWEQLRIDTTEDIKQHLQQRRYRQVYEFLFEAREDEEANLEDEELLREAADISRDAPDLVAEGYAMDGQGRRGRGRRGRGCTSSKAVACDEEEPVEAAPAAVVIRDVMPDGVLDYVRLFRRFLAATGAVKRRTADQELTGFWNRLSMLEKEAYNKWLEANRAYEFEGQAISGPKLTTVVDGKRVEQSISWADFNSKPRAVYGYGRRRGGRAVPPNAWWLNDEEEVDPALQSAAEAEQQALIDEQEADAQLQAEYAAQQPEFDGDIYDWDGLSTTSASGALGEGRPRGGNHVKSLVNQIRRLRELRDDVVQHMGVQGWAGSRAEAELEEAEELLEHFMNAKPALQGGAHYKYNRFNQGSWFN